MYNMKLIFKYIYIIMIARLMHSFTVCIKKIVVKKYSSRVEQSISRFLCASLTRPITPIHFWKKQKKGIETGLLNIILVGCNEGYLLLQEVGYCTGITKTHSTKYFSVSVPVSFCMFSCSKGHSIRAYLDTI